VIVAINRAAQEKADHGAGRFDWISQWG